MKPENRKFLDDNRHHHNTLVNAGYLRHLNANERDGMQRVMSEEFQKGYTADLWCPDCVAEMVKRLYNEYDKFLERERVELEEQRKQEELNSTKNKKKNNGTNSNGRQ